jgi:hypothetical protein
MAQACTCRSGRAPKGPSTAVGSTVSQSPAAAGPWGLARIHEFTVNEARKRATAARALRDQGLLGSLWELQ